MAVLSDYTSGTITLANGSTAVTGTGTLFDVAKFREGDTLQIQNLTAVIASVNSNTSLTLTAPWTGTSLTNAPYRARYLPDGARVTAQATTLIELLGNGVLSNLAELGVEDGKTPVGNAAGEYELKSTSGFGLQDPTGTLAKFAALTLAARQIFQTDAAGALKAVALAANKALATDANGDVTPIDLGTLGRALLALTTGTSEQYVQGDGTLQAKSGLPVSAATQTALDGKVNKTGDTLTGTASFNMPSTGATAINAYGPRPNSDFNHAPAFVSRAGTSGQGLYAGFHAMEAVGIGMRALIDVVGGSIVATFTFTSAGGLTVPGALAKGSGTFLIDHPRDPFNKNLVHGFVESTEYMNLYRGMVDLEDGQMLVDIDAAFGMMDGTFAALNADVMVTALQAQYVPEKLWVEASLASGKFVIRSENSNSSATVAWMISGRRQDAFIKNNPDAHTDADGRLIPEFDKED